MLFSIEFKVTPARQNKSHLKRHEKHHAKCGFFRKTLCIKPVLQWYSSVIHSCSIWFLIPSLIPVTQHPLENICKMFSAAENIILEVRIGWVTILLLSVLSAWVIAGIINKLHIEKVYLVIDVILIGTIHRKEIEYRLP